MTVKCDNCQTSLKLKQKHLKKTCFKVACPQCKNRIIVVPFILGHISHYSHAELITAIQILNKHNSEKQFAAAVKVLDKILNRINCNALTLKEAFVVQKFLFKIRICTKTQNIVKIIYNFFFDCLEHFISQRISATQILKYNNQLLDINREYNTELVELITNEKQLKKFSELLLESPDSNRALTYFFITIGYLNMYNMKFDVIIRKPFFTEFLKICLQNIITSKENLEKIFENVSNNAVFFSHLVVFILDTFQKDTVNKQYSINCLTKIIQLKSDDWGLIVRRTLVESGHSEVVFKEYVYLLNASRDKTTFFWNYYIAVFSNIEAYWKHYFSKAAHMYIKANSHILFQSFVLFQKQTENNCIKDISINHLHQLIDNQNINIYKNDPKTVLKSSFKIIDQIKNDSRKQKSTLIHKLLKKWR